SRPVDAGTVPDEQVLGLVGEQLPWRAPEAQVRVDADPLAERAVVDARADRLRDDERPRLGPPHGQLRAGEPHRLERRVAELEAVMRDAVAAGPLCAAAPGAGGLPDDAGGVGERGDPPLQ